ncbi:hypothetical protein V2J09_001171 [Rumex salicifolius]
MMIETAKQELELLESKFPNQFEFFKMELKSIIPLHNDLPTSSVATQGSTTVMKRKREEEEAALHSPRRRHRQSRRLSIPTNTPKASEDAVERKMERVKEDESVEVAIERAKACIQKIHELKTQLLIS